MESAADGERTIAGPPGADVAPCPSGFPGATLLYQGAEAKVYGVSFFGRPAVVKERFKKGYRHPSLDERLTTRRLQGEARNLVKARRLGVNAPALFAVDLPRRTLAMERVEGLPMRDFLLQQPRPRQGAADPGTGDLASSRAACVRVAASVGEAIAKLHDGGLIHGDLTTSNILLCNPGEPETGSSGPDASHVGLFVTRSRSSSADGDPPSGPCLAAPAQESPKSTPTANGSAPPVAQAVLIDFGLSFNSTVAEDKAVDLYVPERALLALHSFDFVMPAILDSYCKTSKQWSATFNKLGAVRARGRKRVMVG